MGQFTITDTVVGIAIDVANQYVYTGASQFGNSYYLTKYDLGAGIESRVYVGSSILGIAVDQDTSYVYITTYSDGDYYTRDRLIIYDSNLVKQPWESGDIGNPAGVVVAGEVSYKSPDFLLVKDDNDVDCVSPLISEFEHKWIGTPYNWLYYNIHYDANGHADTNVVITDFLPRRDDGNALVSYYSSDPCGIYDANEHTVTWNIGDISAEDSDTFRIQVAVNYYARPGETIRNYCEIEGDEYFMFTTEDTNVCCYGGNIIYVDEDANGYNNGTSWLNAYEDLQDAFHTARNCGCEQIQVAEGTYKPTDRKVRMISFDLLDEVAVYGGFPPGGGTWFERNPSTYETILSGDIGTPNDLSDNSYHVVKCQDVNNTILDGFTITRGNADAPDDDPNCCGGGIYIGGLYIYNFSAPTITDCNISNNSARYGGGVLNYSSDPNITNCTFSNNSAREGGGAYNYSSSDPNITNCTFTGNTAYNYGGGMVNSYESSPTIINCTFSGNSTTATGENSYGGAICNRNNSDANVTNCTFSNNLASHGGGICNNSSDPNVNNCIFTGNTAVYYGGGIYNYQSFPTVANCVFSGNSSDYAGGGMANYQSSPTVTNCTFSGNSANYYGGGIYNRDVSSPNVTNCIFWGNEAETDGSEIYNYDGGSNPNFTYCDIEGGLNNGPGCGGYPSIGSDNIDSNPLFYDSNDPNDYHLGSDSPCIDAGDPNFDPDPNETDIDGKPRIVNGRVDIGADEFDDRDADFNNDGTVNFIDYAMFANVWQTENPDFSLDDDNDVDMNDLALFVEDWLWQAGWTKTFTVGCTQSMGRGFGLMEGLYPSAPAKQQPTQIKPLDIEYIIKWLDEIWLDEEVRKIIDEDAWLKFMESIAGRKTKK
ncbi:hypothetical protein ES703_45262 [subsurface metagenome]